MDNKIDIKLIEKQVKNIVQYILEKANAKKGDIFVVGCSSSEVLGGFIGQNSNELIGKIIFEAAEEICDRNDVYLACQCCEHLNRALVISEECAEKYGYEKVSVVPWLKGGGSFATAAYNGFKKGVVVEYVKAHCGLDIGSTLIGMHLRHVAVPVRLKDPYIGKAYVTCAYTRPKLIGGDRARY